MIRRHNLARIAGRTGIALAVVASFHAVWVVFGPEKVYIVAQAFVALGATTFTVVYHVTASWWRSVMGRNIMLLIGSIAAILDLGLVFNLLGRPAWMREVWAALFLTIGVAIWARLNILIDAQYNSPEHPGTGTPGKRDNT